MDWKKKVCNFLICRGVAVVQLLGTSIETPRQARAIPKNHGRHVRFRKTTAGACDSEKPRQAWQGAPGNPMVGKMPKKLRF